MKRVFLLSLTLIFLFYISTANAQYYLSGNFGAVLPNDSDIELLGGKGEMSYDAGTIYTGAIGTEISFDGGGRLELEIGVLETEVSDLPQPLSIDITAQTLMFNSYHDYDAAYLFKPFVGLGITSTKNQMSFRGNEPSKLLIPVLLSYLDNT